MCWTRPQPAPLKQQPLQVVLVSRQTNGSSRKRVTRRMGNEGELLAMLASIPGCRVQLVDLATLSLHEQIQLMARTDLLVGELFIPALRQESRRET